VRKLYLGNLYFACRHCYRLRYASQSEHRRERLERRRYKLIRRMGGDGESWSWPERPHGMHRSTYDALLEQLNTIEMAIDDEIYEGMLHARGLSGQAWRAYDEAVEKVAAEFADLDEAEEADMNPPSVAPVPQDRTGRGSCGRASNRRFDSRRGGGCARHL
jgi:hypothetical protein